MIPEEGRLADDLVIARALAAIGRWDEASAQLAPPPDASPVIRASRLLARAQVLAAHPGHPKEVIEGLESALDHFQKAGLARPFLDGLGLACALYLLRREEGVALDRAQRLARSADRLSDRAAAVAARLHAGLAYELHGDLAFADRVLGEALGDAVPGTPVHALVTARRARVAARRGHRGRAATLAASIDPAVAGDTIEIAAARTTDPAERARLARAGADLLAADAALGPVIADLAAPLDDETLGATIAALRAAGHADLAAAIAGEEAPDAPWVADLQAIARGEALVAAGRLAEAAALADQVAPRLTARGFDGHAALAMLLAARCYRLGGSPALAEARVAEARPLAGDDPSLSALVALEVATQAAARGEVAQAVALAEPLRSAEPRIAAVAAVLRAEGLVALGRPREAREALGEPLPSGPALRARALAVAITIRRALGEDPAPLEEALREALAAAAGLPREAAHLAVSTRSERAEG